MSAVSVLLLVRDGMATLPAVLDALDAQRSPRAVERVAIDSGSRDGSRELLAGRVDQLLEIPPQEFAHGRTRNLGMAACRGGQVVLLVQDAVPQGDGWLEALLRPFDDPTVGAVTARQRPRSDAPAVVRRQLASWPAAGATPWRSEPLDAAAFARLAPAERHRRALVDDVCACVRRRAWEQVPFPDVDIAEDLAWGRSALLAGWALAYAPDAIVEHSHRRSARHELRRTRAVHRQLARLFGLVTVPTAAALARAVASSTGRHLVESWRTPAELPRALALAWAWPLGQYLGARAACSDDAGDVGSDTATARLGARMPGGR